MQETACTYDVMYTFATATWRPMRPAYMLRSALLGCLRLPLISVSQLTIFSRRDRNPKIKNLSSVQVLLSQIGTARKLLISRVNTPYAPESREGRQKTKPASRTMDHDTESPFSAGSHHLCQWQQPPTQWQCHQRLSICHRDYHARRHDATEHERVERHQAKAGPG